MALHTARMAELNVPSEAYLVASRFLDRCQENPADPSRYKYKPTYPVDREQRLSMTASGLLARQWLGWPHHLAAMRLGANYLLSEEERPDWDNGRRNVYGWYYQAGALHNMGGESWKEWFAVANRSWSRTSRRPGRIAEAGTPRGRRGVGTSTRTSAVVCMSP
ncbi:MAG: hypothetical protein R3B90_19105 [Planctomycetaceae bacterium]